MFYKIILFLFFILLSISVVQSRDLSLYDVFVLNDIECYTVDGNMNILNCNLDIHSLCSVLSLDNIRKINMGNEIIYEGYSDLFSNYNVVDGLKVNIQISISSDSVIIGYPLINGSF